MGLFEKLGLTEAKEESPKLKKEVASKPIVNTNTIPLNMDNVGEYDNIIEEAMEKANLPGPDFREFYKALKLNEAFPLPEQQKYIMAFSGLSTMGLTKEKMINSSEIYLKKIDEEKQEFQKNIEDFISSEVTAKSTESERLGEENAQLQRQIQENMTKISQLNMEVMQNQQKASTKQQQFNATIDKKILLIQAIVNNIKTYL